MKRSICIALLAAGLGVPAIAAPGDKQPATKPADPKAALLRVLDVERQSQAYYRAVLNKHRPIHPFGMVYRMELRHEDVLADELKAQDISIPDDRWQARTIDVPEEKDEALAQAVEMEQKTVRAYDRAIKQTSSDDVRKTLERLRAESADHQKWFGDPESCPMPGRGGRGPGAGQGPRGPGGGRGAGAGFRAGR